VPTFLFNWRGALAGRASQFHLNLLQQNNVKLAGGGDFSGCRYGLQLNQENAKAQGTGKPGGIIDLW
jgi:hypothetical protein